MSSAEGEKTEFSAPVRQNTLLFTVSALADGGTREEPAQTGEEGKEVTSRKDSSRAQTDGEEKVHTYSDFPHPKAEDHKRKSNQSQSPMRQAAEQGIQEHTATQQMQDAEPNAQTAHTKKGFCKEGHITNEQGSA